MNLDYLREKVVERILLMHMDTPRNKIELGSQIFVL